MARAPIAAMLLAQAIDAVDAGSTPEDVARRPEFVGRVSQRTIYNALKARAGGVPPSVPPGTGVKMVRGRGRVLGAVAGQQQAAPPPALPPKKGETDLEIVEAEIVAVRASLTAARTNNDGARTASLLGELRKLMADRRELRPPPPPDPADEERKWRAEAEAVVRMIESGVAAAEGSGAAT